VARDVFVLDRYRWQIEHEDVEYTKDVLERLVFSIRQGQAELVDPYVKELASYPKIEF
jgi:hypothetical protein